LKRKEKKRKEKKRKEKRVDEAIFVKDTTFIIVGGNRKYIEL